MADGFAIEYDENWTMLSQRLATFGEKVAKQITVSALKESAAFMKQEAVRFVNDSDRDHKLLVKGEYIELHPTNLRKHIRYGRISPKYLEPGEVGYRVFVRIKIAWYAKFLEYGTSEMKAQPFMRPAFEHNMEKLARIFKEMVDLAILEGGF